MPPLGRRGLLGGALGVAALAAAGGELTACGTPGAPRAAAGAGAPALPSADEMIGWIRQIVARGVRRPGYAADGWAQEFILARFRAFGLRDVHAEPVEVTRWEPLAQTLVATPEGGAPVVIDCFPLGFSRPVAGLTGRLAGYDPARPTDLSGAVAYVDGQAVKLPPALVAGFGSAPEDLTRRVYDPGGTFAGQTHHVPFVSGFDPVPDAVAKAGAAALVVSLRDYPTGRARYYFPYNGRAPAVPGVWIGDRDGQWLRDQLARGPVQVRLEIATSSAPARSDNLVGDLAGPPGDDETVLVASHHDGPWASAVEDGTGIALVLAQAAYWSQVPAERRPHPMRFLLQGGHMCGGAGLVEYVRRHADELDTVVLEIHLEHAAREFAAAGDGTLAPTGQCVPRWFFTSRIPALEAAVYDALVAERLGRSMLLAPDAFGPMPLTDGALYPGAGVPVVQFLGAPWYLFDEVDTLDKVDQDGLVPLGRAVIRMIESTRGVTAGQIRAG